MDRLRRTTSKRTRKVVRARSTEGARRGTGSAARPPRRARAPRPITVAGLCICGGRSRRMGRDKAELELCGTTMLDRAIATLGEVAPRVLLATGARRRYASRGLEVVL